MPTYEYQCQACGQHTEVFQKISDAPIKKCQECGKNKLQKQVSPSAFHLKGSGWYVTDFKDKGKKQGKEEEKTADKSEKESKDDGAKAVETKSSEIAKEVKTTDKTKIKTKAKADNE